MRAEIVFEKFPVSLSCVSRALREGAQIAVLDSRRELVSLPKEGNPVLFLGLEALHELKFRTPALLAELSGGARIVCALRTRQLDHLVGIIDLCDGIVFVDSNLQHLRSLLDLAIDGYYAVPGGLCGNLLSGYARAKLLPLLTERERRALDCLGRAYSNARIAEELATSEAHAKNLVRSVFAKLYFQNRTEAGVFAARRRSAAHQGPVQERVCNPSV